MLERPGKGGLGGAYRAGFQHAFAHGYEVVVQMDADLSHPPDRLPALLAEVDKGADIAIGSRYVAGGATANWPFVRQVLSRVGNLYASTVLGLGVKDATAGFRAYRADILETVETSATKATGYGFQLELSYRAHRLGATIVEVPITFNDRVRGVSKMSWHIIGEAMTLVTWWGLRDRVFRRNGPAVKKADRARTREVPPVAVVDGGRGRQRRRARRPRGPRGRRRGRHELTARRAGAGVAPDRAARPSPRGGAAPGRAQ